MKSSHALKINGYNIFMLSDRLAEKLGITENSQICVVDAPEDFVKDFVTHMPESVRVTDYIGLRGFDLILWWPQTIAGLEHQLSKFTYCIKPAGSIWLVIPKRQFATERGITFSWAELQAYALQTDLVDNKTVSISNTDYATRFIIRAQHRYKYK